MRIVVSREEVLLDTGGGLKKAAWFFLEDGGSKNQPFLVHNVDVLSTIDLARMVRFHAEHNALATLAVQQRDTSRPLLFNEQGQLCGRRAGRDAEIEWPPPAQEFHAFAFSGIHVLSPRIFANLSEEGAFSIIPPICTSPLRVKRSSPFAPTNPTGAISAGLRTLLKPKAIWPTQSPPQIEAETPGLDLFVYSRGPLLIAHSKSAQSFPPAVRWEILRIHIDQVHGKGQVVGTLHKTAGKKIHVSELQVRAVPNRVQIRAIWPVRQQRIIVPVDECYRLW
jgi:hypothetical protein